MSKPVVITGIAVVVLTFGGCWAGIYALCHLPEPPKPTEPPCPTGMHAVVIAGCESEDAINHGIARLGRCGYEVVGPPQTAANWMGCETTLTMRRRAP